MYFTCIAKPQTLGHVATPASDDEQEDRAVGTGAEEVDEGFMGDWEEEA